MLMQQSKTWTTARSLNPHILTRQRSAPRTVVVTCSDTTTVRPATLSPQACSIAASTTSEDAGDRERESRVTEASKLPQADPQPTKRAKTLLSRNASNVGALMKTINFQAPLQIAAASCTPRPDMWLPCEAPAPVEIPDETFLEGHEHIFHKPHVMLRSVSSTPYAAESLGDSSWDEERDKDILREYFQDPNNIVLHSDCPRVAPHIVITTAEETPDDFYIPWNNRTLPQWSGFLMVPPHDLTTGRLLHPSSSNLAPKAHKTDSDEDIQREKILISPAHTSKAIFSRSRFNAFVERTANERLILYHVVTALQKHQCRVAAYVASTYAASFCRRYEMPALLASLERPFRWTDPAEAVLLSGRRVLGATIIESSCPFIAPHILINSPPPQNPWISWHNAVNDPQDGRYLIVPCPRVNYVNMDKDEEADFKRTMSPTPPSRFFFASDDEEGDVEDESDYEAEDDQEADRSESPPPSRPSSPGPETPTDDTVSMRSFLGIRRSSFVIDDDDEDDRALALAIAKNAVEEYHRSSLYLSLPVIEEEDSLDMEGFSPTPSIRIMDEEDDLPPLDDWYLGDPSRILTPRVATV